jgi:hypothetical protein
MDIMLKYDFRFKDKNRIIHSKTTACLIDHTHLSTTSKAHPANINIKPIA